MNDPDIVRLASLARESTDEAAFQQAIGRVNNFVKYVLLLREFSVSVLD